VTSRPALPLAALALAGALAGCGGGKAQLPTRGLAPPTATHTATTTTRPATVPAAPAGPTTCMRAAQPKPRPAQHLPKPTLRLDPAHTWFAMVATSCGDFVITLDVKHAPKTTASFAYLARSGFYNGLTFHRIVPGFVIQGGDPAGNGSGGPGYKVVEAPPKSLRYVKGVVAMAKTEIEDPGTSGSQFFVVTGPDAQLPADYALVGRVTSGLAAIDRIATQPTNQASPDPALREQPSQPVVIRRVTIGRR
jgi:peptidyl-prolyl cis-trans isomerase B (cyclophilin B)